MSTLTVGIAGITGKFARLLALKLLENPNIVLRGYAREPSKVDAHLAGSSRVHLFKGEAYDDAAIQPFVAGCQVVVCAYLGPNELMTNGQKKLIDACEAAGVPRYVASDWAMDYTKLNLGDLFPKDPMIHVKEHLERKRTVKGVHILIGAFMDTILSSFFPVWDPDTRTLRYWGQGIEAWEGTSYANAAAFTAAVIADTTAVGIMKYLGDRKSILDIAAAFEKVYGFKPKTERLGSLDELKAHMQAMRAEKPSDVYSYMPLFYMYYCLNGQTYIGPDTGNRQYPEIKPETWEDFLRRHTPEDLANGFAMAK